MSVRSCTREKIRQIENSKEKSENSEVGNEQQPYINPITLRRAKLCGVLAILRAIGLLYFFACYTEVFFFLPNPKNLDLSYTMALDLLVIRKVKTRIYIKIS